MALRILLIFILLFNFHALAADKKTRVLKQAKALHTKNQFKRSNQLIAKSYNLKKTKKIPTAILYLFALNLHKQGNHAKSVYYFNQLIKHSYLKTHIKVIKALKKDTLDEVEIPKLLNSIYFYMAQSYYNLYSKNQRNVNAEKAQEFFTICDETDFNDKCSEFLENLTAKKEYAIKSIKSFEFYISAGSVVFQDSLSLKNSATGEQNDILANNSTFCYGAGLRYGNSYKGYYVSGCAFSGAATVQSASSATVGYKQAGVPVAGAIGEFGYYIKPVSDQARLGLSIPVMVRSGSYQEPTGYKFENKQQTSYGISLNSGWEFSFFELQFKLANLQSTNLFAVQGLINF